MAFMHLVASGLCWKDSWGCAVLICCLEGRRPLYDYIYTERSMVGSKGLKINSAMVPATPFIPNFKGIPKRCLTEASLGLKAGDFILKESV